MHGFNLFFILLNSHQPPFSPSQVLQLIVFVFFMKKRKSERTKCQQNFENKILDTESESEDEKIIKALKIKRSEKVEKKILHSKLINYDTRSDHHQQQQQQSQTSSLQIRLKIPKTSTEQKNHVINLPKDMDPEPVCPICLKIIIGDFDDINEHVDECIGSQTQTSSSAITSTSITPIGTPEPPIMSLNRSCSLINVDEDDVSYGKCQYTELDIERVVKSEGKCKQQQQKTEDKDEIAHALLIQNILNSPILNSDFHNLQRALRSILDRTAAAPKCAVCWDTLKMPAVTSVNCWHVCCEGCWLRTLGTKRLCPHCSAITNPSDLRKVFF